MRRYDFVGEKETNGTYKKYMKSAIENDKMGEKTFEKGERRMLEHINNKAIKDAKLKAENIDLYLGGDLMNQLVSSNYVAEGPQIRHRTVQHLFHRRCFLTYRCHKR